MAKNVYDPRTNTYTPMVSSVIGFDRTTGQPIYGDVPMIGGDAGKNDKWYEQRKAQYEKDRVNTTNTQTSFTGIQDPETVAAIKQALLTTAAKGDNPNSSSSGTSTEVAKIDSTLADYTKKAAFEDAAALIQQSLNKSMESQRPAITKAIEGAGTSASSMQALLSQKLASQASIDAGALGAEQAKAYGNISANLLGTQGKLVTDQQSLTSQYATDIAKLGDLLKIQHGSQSMTDYFSADEMNPKDGTAGKYAAPSLGKTNLSKTSYGTYY